MSKDDKLDDQIKNAAEEFLDNMAKHYYEGANQKSSNYGHTYTGKTAFLDYLKLHLTQ